MPIHCLRMLPNNVLTIGLNDGRLATWDLNTNAVNMMQNHTVASTAIHRHENYLITGDAQGNMQVMDTSSAQVVLKSPPVNQQSQVKQSPILSINLIEGSMPIVVGGDKDGQLSFLTLETDPQSQQQVPLQCS